MYERKLYNRIEVSSVVHGVPPTTVVYEHEGCGTKVWIKDTAQSNGFFAFTLRRGGDLADDVAEAVRVFEAGRVKGYREGEESIKFALQEMIGFGTF